MAHENEGVWPVDPSTEVGWLRISINDMTHTPEHESGTVYFQWFSDAALQTIIDLYPDDRAMQIGTAYQRIGMALAQTGQRVRVDDIEIDTRSQAETYFSMARQWFEVAGSASSAEAFQIVPTGVQATVRPEGTPYPVM